MEDKRHFVAHQQALVKNHIVTAVLAFNEHNEELLRQTFAKFDYDEVVDLCYMKELGKDTNAGIGSSWDGERFHYQQFPSWTLDENHRWVAPTPKPEGEENYVWDEESLSWKINQATIENSTQVNE
jgi:hypothetical protein